METRGRRARQWLDAAKYELTFLGVHHPATSDDVAELAAFLTDAAATHGRLHVVVLVDAGTDPTPSGAQTQDPRP
jgi:hypothetical protein